MKRRPKVSVYILLVFLFVWAACDTKSNVDPVYKNYFIKYYGEDGNQEGKDILVNNDGTLVILGTSTTITGSKKMYLAKTDVEGEIIWERKLGSSSDEVAVDIEPILIGPDIGNFAVLSNVTKSVGDSLAIRLTIISPAGDSLKSTLLNQLKSQEAKSITPLSDGGYFITGKTIDTDPLNVGNLSLTIPDVEDMLLIRLQNDFLPTQLDRIGGSSIGSGIKIFEGPSIFYYAGDSDEINLFQSPDIGGYESNFTLRVIEPLNASGTPTGYAGTATNTEELTAIAKSPFGNYLAVGTQTLAGGDKKIFASIVNSNFSAGTEDAIEDNVEGVAVVASVGVDFLVVGNKINPGGRDIWLAKVGTTLSVQFSATFGGSNNDDTASAVAELPNGDIVILGTMELVNQNKIALIKLRSNGQF